MESCFNFLINVDQCLNMSRYDMFFYRLQNGHKFHVSSVLLEGDSKSSLKSAAKEIRMYLNKFPSHVSNYRIVVCMRQKYRKSSEIWRDTVLYRLLSIYYALQEVNIYIKSRDLDDRALHLIVLNDTDMDIHVDQPAAFYTEEDFEKEFEVFRKAACLDSACQDLDGTLKDAETFADRLKEIAERVKETEPLISEILSRYVAERLEVKTDGEYAMDPIEEEEEIGRERDEEDKRRNNPFILSFGTYVQKLIDGYMASQRLADSCSWERNIEEQLRIVEYLNQDLSTDFSSGIESSTKPLSSRCMESWQKLLEDVSFFSRYSQRLKGYEVRLIQQEAEMQSSYAESAGNQDLKSLPVVVSDAPIKGAEDEEVKDKEEEEDRKKDIGERKKKVYKKRSSFLKAWRPADLESGWRKTSKALVDQMNSKDRDLEVYASELSSIYQERIRRRAREYDTHRKDHFKMTSDVEKEIIQLKNQRRALAKELAAPQMTPSLRFQDRLNLDTALARTSSDMEFYLKGIKETKISVFLSLMAGLGGAFLLHYLLLQTQVLSEPVRLLCFILYGVVMFLLFLTAFRLPEAYYRRKMDESIRQLAQAEATFLEGYYKKKENFRSYINNLDRLDEVTKRLELLTQTSTEYQKAAREYDWHKVQIRIHLEKARYFKDMYRAIPVKDTEMRDAFPSRLELSKGVVDNPIYWPC